MGIFKGSLPVSECSFQVGMGFSIMRFKGRFLALPIVLLPYWGPREFAAFSTILALSPTQTSKIFGRVSGPNGVSIGPTKIVMIPWTPREWENPIPDNKPEVKEFFSNERGRFTLPAPPGCLLRVRAENPKLGLVSSVHLRVIPGKPLALSLFPASKLILPPSGQDNSWILLGQNPETQRPYLFAWGTQKKSKESKEILLPPGKFRLRILRQDSCSATLSFSLSPKEKKWLRPHWEKPATLIQEKVDSRSKKTLLLPPLFAPPGGGVLPLSKRVLKIPSLQGLILKSWVRMQPGSFRALDLGPFQPGERSLLEIPAEKGREVLIQLPSASGEKTQNFQLTILWWDLGRRVQRHLKGINPRQIRIQGIPKPGPILVKIEGPNGQLGYTEAKAGQAHTVLKPMLHPSAGLDLKVFSPDGMPSGGDPVRIQALKIQGLSLDALNLLGTWKLWTNPLGRLHLRGLPEGKYRIHILPGLHNEMLREVQLFSKQIHRLQLQLTTGFHLEGRILDPKGKPVSGVLVKLSSELLPPTTSQRKATTDSKGRFQFLSLGKGPFSLEAIQVRGNRTFFARKRGVTLDEKETVLILQSEDPKNPFKKSRRD